MGYESTISEYWPVYSNIISNPEIREVTVYMMGNNDVFIEFLAMVNVELTFNIDKYYVVDPEEKISWLAQSGGPISILIYCSLVHNVDSGSVSSFNLEDIKKLRR